MNKYKSYQNPYGQSNRDPKRYEQKSDKKPKEYSIDQTAMQNSPVKDYKLKNSKKRAKSGEANKESKKTKEIKFEIYIAIKQLKPYIRVCGTVLRSLLQIVLEEKIQICDFLDYTHKFLHKQFSLHTDISCFIYKGVG